MSEPPIKWRPYLVMSALAIAGLSIIWALCLNFIAKEQDRVQIFLALAVNYLILMAMFVQAYIYNRQSNSMREGLNKTQTLIRQNERMIDETRQFREMTERPILVVEKADAPLKLDEPMKMSVIVVNKGRTAAQNLRIYFRLSKPGETEFPFTDDYLEIPFLAAQDTLRIYDEGIPIRICDAPTFRSVVEMAHQSIYIYGNGTYEDLAGKQYPLDKWVFGWTKEHGFTNDYFTLPYYEWLRNKLEEANRRDPQQDKEEKAN